MAVTARQAAGRVKAETAGEGFGRLLEVAGGLAFEPHDIAGQLDARGRYEVPLDEEFPLLIKLFHYTSKRHTRGATWHDRLELFLPLDGRARFRMGDQEVMVERGDLLVVDNLRLHQVVDFPGFDTRVVVMSFRPEFVYSLGSPSHDYAYLLPFYLVRGRQAQVRRLTEVGAESECGVLVRFLECYFAKGDRQYYQAGCKACLLELLYGLARHFRGSEVLHWEFVRQQQRSVRLKPLFDHIARHYADKMTLSQASAMVHMSQAQFMKTFKNVAGMTLVTYVNHVRLAIAVQLLRETGKTIAEIANEVGFSDQSYFDRRFKVAFGQSPRDFRRGGGA